MPQANPFKFIQKEGKEYIYDTCRKKYVVLTPEEWVRQHFIYYLIHEKKYPASLISVEKQIVVGNRKKRYDIVVYKADIPWMIVECKHEGEKITEHTLQQILSYQSALQVRYLVLTNGNEIHCLDVEQNKWMSEITGY